jgi:hypothetical protein
MRRVSVAGAASLAIGLVMVFAPAAQAAKSDCTSGKLCGWYNQNYGGTLNQYTNDYNDMGKNSDEWHSVYNRDNVAWLLYDDKNYQGSSVKCAAAGAYEDDLGSFGDKVSSIKKRTVAGCSGYNTI